MPKKYPPLKRSEIVKILSKHGFKPIKTRGSHEHFVGHIKGVKRKVTVIKNRKEFDYKLLPSIIAQSGLSYKEFYNTLKTTGKKI